ncbi:MAG: hypothetical protein ACD_38C00048G0003 [uncultured bacterium]|uniref:Adenylate kinase n=1 Tax=Candidatus Daviesbacteria bacterium RIFCSPHIGHO2_01_FULL_40_11 TaxID=1797762 RepID=A0A1F5JJG1_9BACT|nr:MAG: hypothetical protein ACD_38C00048G0003 [uncultured bacterium]OGE28787.1 MAG: hypothetical protein A2867_04150 [Candidatus Daviesbacteria bacterium RIFCSPHIGHO2_01_FULL_40_11]OGE62897.1 MAG: hypothetical protein A2964_01345 [Candidatus Daviesbacteria bacterium RIFCSPLOWO2_01_FULL_40_27]
MISEHNIYPSFTKEEDESSLVIVLFGLPGSGKSLAGEILSRNFNFRSYQADSDYTAPMKLAMQENRPIPEEMRNDGGIDDLTGRLRRLIYG